MMFKKLFSFIFLLIMMVSFVGCSGAKTSDNSTNTGTFEGLDYVTERQICEAYYNMRLVDDEYVILENVNIYEYYGTHNGYPVVMMHPGGWFIISHIFIDGIYFYNPNLVWEIFIFKDNTLINFIEAYHTELLTRENLRDIQEARLSKLQYSMPNLDERTIWNGSISEDFDDQTIIVTIFKEFKGFVFKPELNQNYEQNTGDFKLINAVSVEKISGELPYYSLETKDEYEAYRQVLEVKIANKSKQNVIDAIRILEDYDFVQSATPKYASE